MSSAPAQPNVTTTTTTTFSQTCLANSGYYATATTTNFRTKRTFHSSLLRPIITFPQYLSRVLARMEGTIWRRELGIEGVRFEYPILVETEVTIQFSVVEKGGREMVAQF